jgi:hypothetical protein
LSSAASFEDIENTGFVANIEIAESYKPPTFVGGGVVVLQQGTNLEFAVDKALEEIRDEFRRRT